jgi:hypothetical protein
MALQTFFAQTARPVVPEGGLPYLRQGVSWMLWIGLVACVAAMLYGGATWGLGALFGGQGGQSKGRNYVICGAVGALVLGLSFVVLNGMLDASINAGLAEEVAPVGAAGSR